jgi:hypothetical protein
VRGVLDALDDGFKFEDSRNLDHRGGEQGDLAAGVGQERADDLEDVDGQAPQIQSCRGMPASGGQLSDRSQPPRRDQICKEKRTQIV